ncbi:hypothetical protein GUITHDRAFT_141535 [Guillardia theta CCMP2712]|uniref:Uncharacterized protein n=1 Tax=Guillardia theta (strain CCMP2712) TaxID=905079 RepID=L1J1P6_GUITC|nr:hypothetical protein GUITHDRAFT_141535 [Guillardia theta CCMP2712]EKX42064.1 hypothetical protein GUITHDRAFT_141535 [Guillardia theta CCMP2712]|eukprot:XP_005829044.1 hypothetical protein GUITHDRAFT_141535 [Guillardia theta CCMP2712]
MGQTNSDLRLGDPEAFQWNNTINLTSNDSIFSFLKNKNQDGEQPSDAGARDQVTQRQRIENAFGGLGGKQVQGFEFGRTPSYEVYTQVIKSSDEADKELENGDQFYRQGNYGEARKAYTIARELYRDRKADNLKMAEVEGKIRSCLPLSRLVDRNGKILPAASDHFLEAQIQKYEHLHFVSPGKDIVEQGPLRHTENLFYRHLNDTPGWHEGGRYYNFRGRKNTDGEPIQLEMLMSEFQDRESIEATKKRNKFKDIHEETTKLLRKREKQRTQGVLPRQFEQLVEEAQEEFERKRTADEALERKGKHIPDRETLLKQTRYLRNEELGELSKLLSKTDPNFRSVIFDRAGALRSLEEKM